MKKENIIIISVLGSLLILFMAYFFGFFLFKPFDNMVTEDRPIVKWLCEKQANCHIFVADMYSCSYKGEVIPRAEKMLKHWNDYRGCNESTRGYYEEYPYGYVKGFEMCGCGGIQ